MVCTTESAIYNLVRSIIQFIDGRGHIAFVISDLSKVFDCLDHSILITMAYTEGQVTRHDLNNLAEDK